MSAPKVDVLISAGDLEARVQSLRIRGEAFVAVTLPFADGALTVTFETDRFSAFVERLREFAERLPKPS